MGEISGGEWLLIGCAIVLAAGLLDAATKWARKQYTPGDRSPELPTLPERRYAPLHRGGPVMIRNPRRLTDVSERIDDRELRVAFLAVRLYAETHPRPAQVTQQQAAEMLGMTRRTVHNYIRTGRLKLNSCGHLPIEAIDAIRAPNG